MRFDRSLLVLAFVVACDSKQPDASPELEPKTEQAKTALEETPKSVASEEKTIQETPQLADIGDDEWCDEAHGDAVKLVTAMKETMAGNGQDADGDQYTVPERANYVALCEKLPATMQKCLVLAYARQNKEACREAREGLDPRREEIYGELMGQ